MKKKMVLTLAVSAFLMTAVCASPVREMAGNVNLQSAADAYDDGWRYYFSDVDFPYTLKYAGDFPDGELLIPASVNFDHEDGSHDEDDYIPEAGTYTMYFSGIETSDRSLLKKVTMEDGALIAFNYMDTGFHECSSLVSVRLPADLPFIPYACFSGCSSLSELEIPESVRQIGGSAFADCSSLTELTIPKNVEFIDQFAFSNCTNLQILTIENPNCDMADNYDFLYNYIGKAEDGNLDFRYDGVIRGYDGSTAEEMAKGHGWRFESLGAAPESPKELPLAPEGSCFGDVDGDKDITVADAQFVLTYYVEAITGKTPSWSEITGNANAPS